jgi:hypothetical protein
MAHYFQIVGLERGPLSLVRIIEELPEWKSSGSGQENRINGREIRCAGHTTPYIRTSWHQLRRQAAVARSV